MRRRPRAAPLPRRPYRDSALFYGGLALIIVVVATGWSWWRFRGRLERGERR